MDMYSYHAGNNRKLKRGEASLIIFFPRPYQGRGKNIRREAKPLFDTPLVFFSLKGEGEEILERGRSPLSYYTPFPY